MALGLAFGVALSVAIPDDIIDRVSVPGVQMVGLIVLAVVFGLLAAVFPSYRAGRMNVLEASPRTDRQAWDVRRCSSSLSAA